MNKLLVIADDFTGALDTGVQFSKKGVPAPVLTADRFLAGESPAVVDAADVLVVDAESRRLPAEEARDIVAAVARHAMRHGFRRFYKKTDSALRGNIGAELEGLLEAVDFSRPCLTFVPAFPKSRRVTRGGVHYIDGVEAARSVFSKDPFTPVTRSAVADVIHLQTDIPTENITSGAYAKAALKPEPSKKTIRILDAESMEDIEALGFHLKRGGNLDLLAGCAGFAEILPELLELPRREVKLVRSGDGLLVVSGSVNPITVEQTALGESFGFNTFTLSLKQKLDERYPLSAECADFAHRVSDALLRGGRAVVRAVEDTAEVELSLEYARAQGIAEHEIPSRVADNIGEITRHILNAARVGNLAVFGGDTLHGVLSKTGCGGVVPLAEIAPGVVAAKTLSGDYSGLVITKSGGLGDKDVLSRIAEFAESCRSR